MIVLHHLENSRSQRILWLLEELGVDYQIKRYERDKETALAPPQLLAVHPLGKSPVITDGNITVAESGAIIEYLVEKYGAGRLVPAAGTPERMAYTYWLHYAEGTLMPFMVLSLIMNRIETAPMPFFIRPVAKGIVAKIRDGYLDPNIQRNLDFMEATLAKSNWFAGNELTAADIQMSFALEAAEVRTKRNRPSTDPHGLRTTHSTNYPNLARFLERMRERPAYQSALKKGGAYKPIGGD